MADGCDERSCLSSQGGGRRLGILALVAALASGAAAAAHHRRGGPGLARGRPAWHGDIRRFPEHDWGVWRGGRWYHGRHGGHLGWWWIVGGAWYFYPAPIYPYPDPYAPPGTVPPPVQYWYYCPPAGTYYPYVAACPYGWRQVPAGPPLPP